MNKITTSPDPVDQRVGRPAPERGEYTGVRCMCVLTGCRAGPGCPHYCSHCKAHIALVSKASTDATHGN